MFTLSLRIYPTADQEELLYSLMRTYAHSYNVMVSHAKKCLNLLKQNKRYRELLKIYKKNGKFTTAEKSEINNIIKSYGLNEAAFKKYLSRQNRYNKYENSRLLQDIAERVWQAVEKVLYSDGEEVHFKKRNDFLSFAGNDNKTGIIFKNKTVYVAGQEIKVLIKHRDTYAKEALKNEVKMCRIKRKWHKNSWRYYVDIVLDGNPPKKHKTANGTVGIDIGPSTIAVDSENGSILEELGKDVDSIEHELRIINRKIDRQRRANNPENYNPDGTIRKNTKTFKKKWKRSKSQLKTEHKRRELYRLHKAKLELSHNLLANRILELGNKIIIEDMQFHALAKRAKETKKDEDGKFKSKKRFGKSIENHAPSKFVNILEWKLKNNGGELIKVDCFKTAATQFDHTSGAYYKHELSERFVTLDNGDVVQRDLHSAFNLRHLIVIRDNKTIVYEYDINSMNLHYADFKIRHDVLI